MKRFDLCDNIICNSNKNKLCVENELLIETVYKQQGELVKEPSEGSLLLNIINF